MANSIWASVKNAYENGILDFGAIVGGSVFYCDAVHGSDVWGTGKRDRPFASLSSAYGACTAGHNDVVVILSDGQTTGTQRVDAAFTWEKDSTHLVGVGAPLLVGQRARIAPTSSTTAFAAFFTVSADNCLFQNVAWYHDFATDTDNQIALTVSGERNAFKNCQIAGVAKGSDAGGRSLRLSGGGENLFENCTIGVDTISRGAANATVDFSGGTARNVFRNCVFPVWSTAATTLVFKIAAGNPNGADRFVLLDNCTFLNFGTTSTALATFAATGMNGYMVFNNPCLVGFTGFGSDATTRAMQMICGGTPATASTGLAVAPTA